MSVYIDRTWKHVFIFFYVQIFETSIHPEHLWMEYMHILIDSFCIFRIQWMRNTMVLCMLYSKWSNNSSSIKYNKWPNNISNIRSNKWSNNNSSIKYNKWSNNISSIKYNKWSNNSSSIKCFCMICMFVCKWCNWWWCLGENNTY